MVMSPQVAIPRGYYSGPWTPRRLAGKEGWYDASQIGGLADGDPVTTWPDMSGKKRDATSSGASRPTFKVSIVNGKSVVRFDGVGTYMNLGNVFNFERTDTFTIYVVSQTEVNSKALIGKLTAGAEKGWGLAISGADFLQPILSNSVAGTLYLQVSGSTDVVNASWWITPITYTGNSLAAGVTNYVNGAAETPTVDNDNLGANSIVHAGNTSIGARADGTEVFFSGDIAEILVVGRVVSVSERRLLDKYFGRKYGLAVS